MTSCDHYEGEGAKKHFQINDKLKCELCNKQLNAEDIKKLKEKLGK